MICTSFIKLQQPATKCRHSECCHVERASERASERSPAILWCCLDRLPNALRTHSITSARKFRGIFFRVISEPHYEDAGNEVGIECKGTDRRERLAAISIGQALRSVPFLQCSDHPRIAIYWPLQGYQRLMPKSTSYSMSTCDCGCIPVPPTPMLRWRCMSTKPLPPSTQ